MMELSDTIRSDLDAIRKMVEDEMGYDITNKSTDNDEMMAKRMFVNLVDAKYDLRESPLLINKPLMAQYMELNDSKDVNYLLLGFDMYIKYNHKILAIWEKLRGLSDSDNATKLRYLKDQLKVVDANKLHIEEQIKLLTDGKEEEKGSEDQGEAS